MVVLADLISRDQFQRDVLLETLRRSVFWDSGVIRPDSELARLIKAGVGSGADFDYFLDLDPNEPNISDDSNTLAGTDGITTDSSHAIFNYRNRAWGAKNITASLSTTGDPMTAITGRIGQYWATQMDLALMAIVDGIFADNIANNASDMLNDQTGTPIDINMILDTRQTSGDAADIYGTMICHSAIVTSLKKQGVTDRIYSVDSGKFLYESLAGLRLVANDAVPVVAGAYTSYLVGGSAFGLGDGAPKRPNEVEYNALTGNGAGQEILVSRKEFAIHPYGFSFVGVPASTSPTNAEFAAAASWQRDVERKRIPLAALISAI